MAIAKNTICLWYDRDAEAAARFYAETFPDSSVGAVPSYAFTTVTAAHTIAARVGRVTRSFFNPLRTRYLLMHAVRLEGNDGSVIIFDVWSRPTRPISQAQLEIAATASL